MDRIAQTQIPAVKAKLLDGKRGLIVGIANENSIAWGCAKAFRAFGAELAVTYLNDKAKKYVEPLARELEAPIVMPLRSRSHRQTHYKAVLPTCRETASSALWKCPAGPLSAWHTWQNR